MEISAEEIFEQTLLHSILTDTKAFSRVFGILKSEYFQSEERQAIYHLMKDHFIDHQTPPNMQDVAIRIKNLQDVEKKARIVQELKEIHKQECPNIDSLASETLKFVKDALYLKALEIGSEGLMTKSEDLKKKAEQILEERHKINLDSDLGIEFSDVSILDHYTADNPGILTHLRTLNQRLGNGFTKGTLSLIAAPSGVGKSLMMTDLISGFIKKGLNVLLVSLEMSEEEVMKRVHSNTLGIPIAEIGPKLDKDYFLHKLQEARQSGCGVFHAKGFPALSFSALMLDNLLDSYQNEKNLTFDMVFVDYIGIMKSDLLSPSVGLYSYIKSIAEEVRAIAVRREITIISASQLNRCFDIHTKIKTSEGIKSTKDLKIGDSVLSSSGWNTVQEIKPMETKKVYKIRTSKGVEILVTKDHRIPTNRGLLTITHGLSIGDKVSTI